MATGDFNRDGNLDIVVANDNSSSLSLFLGTGEGTFNPAITIPVGAIPVAVAAADFNGDGNLDLAVSLLNSGGFQVLFGNGNGTFQSPIFIPVPSGVLGQITAADLNGDGHPDLAVGEGFGGLQVFGSESEYRIAENQGGPFSAWAMATARFNRPSCFQQQASCLAVSRRLTSITTAEWTSLSRRQLRCFAQDRLQSLTKLKWHYSSKTAASPLRAPSLPFLIPAP
jgi:hypothetical protein